MSRKKGMNHRDIEKVEGGVRKIKERDGTQQRNRGRVKIKERERDYDREREWLCILSSTYHNKDTSAFWG